MRRGGKPIHARYKKLVSNDIHSVIKLRVGDDHLRTDDASIRIDFMPSNPDVSLEDQKVAFRVDHDLPRRSGQAPEDRRHLPPLGSKHGVCWPRRSRAQRRLGGCWIRVSGGCRFGRKQGWSVQQLSQLDVVCRGPGVGRAHVVHGGFGVLVERRTWVGGVDRFYRGVSCVAEQAYTAEVDTASAPSPCRAVLGTVRPRRRESEMQHTSHRYTILWCVPFEPDVPKMVSFGPA